MRGSVTASVSVRTASADSVSRWQPPSRQRFAPCAWALTPLQIITDDGPPRPREQAKEDRNGVTELRIGAPTDGERQRRSVRYQIVPYFDNSC